MVKTKEYSVDLRKRVVDSHQTGEGYDKISKKLDIPKSSVRAIIKKFAAEGHVQNKEGRGRKRILSERAERQMVSYSKSNPRATTKEVLEAMGPEADVSRRTVGRIVRRGGLKACKAMPTRPPGLPPMAPNLFQPSPVPPPIQPPLPLPELDEPLAKKQKNEDSLISESEFLLKHESPVSFRIQVPVASDKAEWRLNGQILTVTLLLTDMVSVVKAKIHDETGMPAGKQKLQYEGIFIKDSNSLAFYNFTPGSLVQLQVKERVGRKK